MKLIIKNSLILALLLLYFYSPFILVYTLDLKDLLYIYKIVLIIYAFFVFSSFFIILFSGKILNLFKTDDLNEFKTDDLNEENKLTEEQYIKIEEALNKVN